MRQGDLYLSSGNLKVKALIFNLPAGLTCLTGLKCNNYCYAKKAEKRFPKVRRSRMRNLKGSLEPGFIDNMLKLIDKQVLKTGIKVIRIHESGDYYNLRYLLSWYEIASRRPSLKFYSYTKRVDLVRCITPETKPANLIMIRSIDGLLSIFNKQLIRGFDKTAYVSNNKHTNCPALKSKSIKCNSGCSKCFNNNKKHNTIVFAKH